MKGGNILISFIALLVSLNALAKSPPPGTGKADMPANILFMVDTSGSMSSYVNSRNSATNDVAIDSKGYVYSVDVQSDRLKKYDSAGTLIWESSLTGADSLNNPYSVDINSRDQIFVADYSNRAIKIFESNGELSRQFVIPSGAYPRSIAVDKESGEFYVGATNGYVYRFSSSGTVLGSKYLRYFYDLSVFDGRLYGVDGYNIYSCSSGFVCSVTAVASGVQAVTATANGVLVARSGYSYFYSFSGASSDGRLYRSSSVYSSSWGYVSGLGSDVSGNAYSAHYGYSYYEGIRKWSFQGNRLLSRIVGTQTIENRLDQIKKVIKRLVSDSELSGGANFGLMNWDSYPNSQIRPLIPVDEKGANLIYNQVDRLRPYGGTAAGRAMLEAKRYLTSADSPIKSNIPCQKTFIILLSDGGFGDSGYDTTASWLLANKGVKTFVVGFNSGTQSTYERLARAGGTGQPLYADSWQQLYSTLTDAIRQAITSNLSFTAPMIMPAQSGGEDHLLQAQFTYKPSNQWEGRLKKYKLDANGLLDTVVWDAGEKLNAKRESTRNIWSPLSWAAISNSLNNFSISNLQGLKSALYANAGFVPSDEEVSLLVKHTRGVDAFDEDGDGSNSDERWKLGDIYHGVPALVGSPNFKVTSDPLRENTEAYYRFQNGYTAFSLQYKDRQNVIYAPSNDGMLHAFDSQTGEEVWAFIPPMVIPKLIEKISSKPNSSNAIFAVDGSPTVKDIFYDGKWRTVLLAGLGRGGQGYYSLDITEPSKPEFLYAFVNYPVEQKIHYFDRQGNLRQFDYSDVPKELDFSRLGEAWSTPQIMLLPYAGTTKWVAVFGGGFNGATNPNYGSSIFVIDLESGGNILKRIDLTDNPGGVVNSVPADLGLINADSTTLATYKGGLVYFTDLESKLWKVNLTDKGTLFDTAQIFDGEATDTNGRLSYFSPALSVDSNNNLWVFFGTGDQQRLQEIGSSISNRVFAVKDTAFPAFTSVMPKTSSSLIDTTSTGSACPTTAHLGWFNSLKPNEKVTGKIAVNNETVFVSKYLPNNLSLCSPGTGSLSEHDFVCGGVYSGGAHELGAGIPTGAVIYKNRIYVGSSSASDEGLDSRWKKIDNITVGQSVKSTAGKGAVKVESWRERF